MCISMMSCMYQSTILTNIDSNGRLTTTFMTNMIALILQKMSTFLFYVLK
jgi:hypothetical protein